MYDQVDRYHGDKRQYYPDIVDHKNIKSLSNSHVSMAYHAHYPPLSSPFVG